jgi:hypothetical protein
LIALGALNAFSTLALYNNNEHFRKYCDDQTAHGKQYMIKSVILPSLMKVEKVKDEGLSTFDVLKVGTALTTCYGIKKVIEYSNIWHALTTGDVSKTREAMHEFGRALDRNKGKIALAGIVAAGALFVWRLAKAADECNKISLIDKFFLTLTNEQRGLIMESPELTELVSEGTTHPTHLQNNEAFMGLLTAEQKQLLTTAVDDYIKHNDPLALLEGLDA